MDADERPGRDGRQRLTLSNPVQVRVTGANGRSDTGSFSVAVTNTTDAPVAANDAIGVRGGTATFAIASLLANDSDPDGDALTGFANSPSSAGMLTNNGNGTLTFTEAVPDQHACRGRLPIR